MTNLIKTTFDKWCDDYKPIPNVFNKDASFNDGDNGIMFETYGKELDFVLSYVKFKPRQVWTYIDGENGTFIINGYHLVNRIGHFVTYGSAEPETFYEVEVSNNDGDNYGVVWTHL